MNLLFICNLGRNRSRTAAELFANIFQTRYRGIYSNLVSKYDIDWADRIFVMEKSQQYYLMSKFSLKEENIICLNINNSYAFNDPELLEIIKSRIKEHI